MAKLPRSLSHLVDAVVGLDPLPDPIEALGVGYRLADRADRPVLLRLRRGRLAVQRNGIRAEVADLEVEDLVNDVVVNPGQRGLLEDELPVDDEREQVPDVEQEVQILLLTRVRGSSDEQLPECPRLLVEP